MEEFISIAKFEKDNNFELIAGEKGLENKITEDEISRPGLEFAGFFDFFESKRVLLIGSKDASFLETLSNDVKAKNLEKIFELNPPCIVFSERVKIDDLFINTYQFYVKN